MSAASKETWLGHVLDIVGNNAGTIERNQLAMMTRQQLVTVEFLLAAVRADACQVGCGGCDWCAAKNRAADEAAHANIRERLPIAVTVMPMTAESRQWVKANKAARSTLIKWEAERMTVRAPNGKQKTFGPHEACWSEIVTIGERR